MNPPMHSDEEASSPTQFLQSEDEGFILDAPRQLCHLRNAPYAWSDGAWMCGTSPREVLRCDPARGERDAMARFEDFAQRFEKSDSAIAVGFLSYDLGGVIEPAAASRHRGDATPALYFATYDEYYSGAEGAGKIRRHRRGRPAEVVTGPRAAMRAKAAPALTAASRTGIPRSDFSREEYMHAVERAREYILAGDIFEVNISQRFRAPFDGDALSLYERLRRANPAPYAAFISATDFAALSCSPELFLRMDGDRIVTRPIKGTARRASDELEDAEAAEKLYNGEKENAELAMIVDLERNDLGRVCEYGSVRVTEARRVETFAKVHHLVATVSGVRRRGTGIADIMRATFPGGSVTGAPKIRAMQIIDELEPCARGIYTGSIGYMLPGGRAEFSIVIRTVVCEGGSLNLQVGGAVTADSDPALEYRETLDKAEAVFEVLSSEAPVKEPAESAET